MPFTRRIAITRHVAFSPSYCKIDLRIRKTHEDRVCLASPWGKTSCTYKSNVLIHAVNFCSSGAWLLIFYDLLCNTTEQHLTERGIVRASDRDNWRITVHERFRTHETHTTARTTSVMTALVGISSLSTPGNPSARVGPTLR